MTDTNRFKAAIALAGMKAGDLAKLINMSEQSLSYKINNKRQFTAVEIVKITEALGLTQDEQQRIFFAN